MTNRQPETFNRTIYEIDFEETFSGPELDSRRWVDHYLPHWTTPDRSAARYGLAGDRLRLRIEADQPAWRPEDGELRVSNIQTGTWSGPTGSDRGLHRHEEGLAVVSPQSDTRLYTPVSGAVEATLRATADPTTMLAFWLVGFEAESGDDSGEICVVELFGSRIGPEAAELSIGVKAHHDPRLKDDMAFVPSPIDATDWHTYTAEWNEHRTRFFVDDQLVRTVDQGFSYPMLLMVDLFEFPNGAVRYPAGYPKVGDVQSVRGYRRRL